VATPMRKRVRTEGSREPIREEADHSLARSWGGGGGGEEPWK
jgi:hypothetical protein